MHSTSRRDASHDPLAFHGARHFCLARLDRLRIGHEERTPRTVPLWRVCVSVFPGGRGRGGLDHVSFARVNAQLAISNQPLAISHQQSKYAATASTSPVTVASFGTTS